MLMTRRTSCIPVFIWMMFEKTWGADDSEDKCYQRNGMEMRVLDENWTVELLSLCSEFSFSGLTEKVSTEAFTPNLSQMHLRNVK